MSATPWFSKILNSEQLTAFVVAFTSWNINIPESDIDIRNLVIPTMVERVGDNPVPMLARSLSGIFMKTLLGYETSISW